jgi:hypothetical protein
MVLMPPTRLRRVPLLLVACGALLACSTPMPPARPAAPVSADAPAPGRAGARTGGRRVAARITYPVAPHGCRRPAPAPYGEAVAAASPIRRCCSARPLSSRDTPASPATPS